MTKQTGACPATVMVVTQVDDPTADLVIDELNRRSRRVVRVDPGDFPRELSLSAVLDTDGRDGHGWRGLLTTSTKSVELGEVGAVYWRRPSAYRFPGLDSGAEEFAATQARVGLGGVLANLPGARYVNHPHCNWAAEYKPAQLVTATELGFTVPPTIVTSDPAAARAFAVKHAPVVFKPLRMTDVRRDGQAVALWTQRVEPDELDDTVAGTAHLFQAEVAGKVADLRITVIGERVFCVLVESPAGLLDWRAGYDSLSYRAVDPPSGLVARVHAFLSRFRLEFGCFDFAIDPAGTPWFLECNPNGQWAWLEPPTGLPMTAAFADALEGHP